MKRNVKNDKVLRAITIGLATMIAATSMPMNVYADDGEPAAEEPVADDSAPAENDEPSGGDDGGSDNGGDENGSQDGGSSAQEFSMTAESHDASLAVPMDPSNALKEINSVVGTEDAAGTLDAIVNPADTQVPGALPVAIADATAAAGADSALVQNLNEAQDDLVNGVVGEDGNKIGGVEENLKTLKSGLESATGKNDKKVTSEDVYATTNGGTVLETENGAYPKNEDQDSEDAGKPQFDANGQLLTVSTNDPLLADFYDSYSDALGALNDLNKLQSESARTAAMGKVEGFVQDASIKLDAARESITGLRNAIKDTKAAEAAVAKAETKAAAIEAVRDQYYAMMVYYFTKNSSVVYEKDENGKETNKLDVEASADKMTMSKINTIAGSCTDKDTLRLGRALLDKMVRAEIMDMDLDVKDISFAPVGSGTTNEKMLDGEVYLNGSGKDQVALTGKKNKDKDGVEHPVSYQPISYTKVYGDNGHNNRFAVVITLNEKDEEGNNKTITKYYNYILKSFDDESFKQVGNGIVSLAEIVQDTDENGNLKFDKNNNPIYKPASVVDTKYDDFATLDAYAAKAKEEVIAAKAKVQALRKQVEVIGQHATNTGTVEKMEARLAAAETALANSEKVFGVLTALLDGYQGPAIKKGPSGNPENPEDPDGDDPTGGDPTYDPGTGTLVIPGYEIPPITLPTTPSGVAGVRAAASRPTGVLGVKAPETKAEKTIANKTVVKPAAKKTVAQKGKKIANPETPLAATPFVDEDGMKIPWIWLLIIAALGAVGKKMYDEHKKKVQAEEEAKKYND